MLLAPQLGSTGLVRSTAYRTRTSKTTPASFLRQSSASLIRASGHSFRKHQPCAAATLSFPESTSKHVDASSTVQHQRFVTEDGLSLEVLTAEPQVTQHTTAHGHVPALAPAHAMAMCTCAQHVNSLHKTPAVLYTLQCSADIYMQRADSLFAHYTLQGKVLDQPPLLFVHGSYHAAWWVRLHTAYSCA